MEKKYTLGILGLGEGRSVISAALSSTKWEIENICDLDRELCKKRCKEFGLSQYTTRYEEMLEDTHIDVIGIYTPDQLHFLHIKMALEAGKDVICTKPLMVSLEKAAELLEIQRRTGRTVFVGQSSRYFEPVLRQRRDFEAGKHGDLLTMETHYISDSRWFLKRGWSHSRGFSWMYNFMIHAVDLAAWYLPHIEEVYGVGVVSSNTRSYQLNVPDTLKFILKDRSGICASVSGVYASPALGTEIEQAICCTLRGTDGVSRAGYPKLEYDTYFEKDGPQIMVYDFSKKSDYYFRFERETHHAGEYQNYIDYFAECLDKGITPKPDLKEGIRTLSIMEAMQKCMETGIPFRTSDVLAKYGLSPNALK